MKCFLGMLFVLFTQTLGAQWFETEKNAVFNSIDSLYQKGYYDSAYNLGKEIYFSARDTRPAADTALMVQALMRLCNISHANKNDCDALYWSDLLFDLSYAKNWQNILLEIPGTRSIYRNDLRQGLVFCSRYQTKKYKFQATRYFKVTHVFKGEQEHVYRIRIDGGSEARIDTLAGANLFLTADVNGKRREFIPGGTGKLDWINEINSQWNIHVNNDKDSAYLPAPGDLLECKVYVPDYISAENTYDNLILKHVEFLDNNRSKLLDLMEMYDPNYNNFLDPVESNMLHEIHQVALYADSFESFRKQTSMKITAGIFKGKTLKYAMQHTTDDHLWAFLRYAGTESRIYAGLDLKIAEAYATWLIYGSSMSANNLCRLLMYVPPASRKLIFNNYKQEILKNYEAGEWKNYGLNMVEAGNYNRVKLIEDVLMDCSKYLKVEEYKGKAYYLKANRFLKLKQNDSARVYFLQAAQIFHKAGMTDEAATSANAVASIGKQALPEIHLQSGHTISFFFEFSHDGKYFATAGMEQVIKIWDAHSGREMFALHGHETAINSLVWTQDSKGLLSADINGRLILWDVFAKKNIKQVEFGKKIKQISFSSDFKTLAMVMRSPDLFLLDPESLKIKSVLKGGKLSLNSCLFLPGTDEVFTAAQDKIIRRWNYKTKKITDTLQCLNRVGGLSYNRYSGNLMASCIGGKILCWDIYQPKGHHYRGYINCDEMIFDFNGDTTTYTGAGDFSPDGRYFFYNRTSDEVSVWDVQNNHLKHFQGFGYYSEQITVSPDGALLGMAGQYGLKMADLRKFNADQNEGFRIKDVPFFGTFGGDVAFSESGKQLYYSADGLRRMDLASGKETMLDDTGFIYGGLKVLSEDRKYYLKYDPYQNNSLRLYNVRTDSLVCRVPFGNTFKEVTATGASKLIAWTDETSNLYLVHAGKTLQRDSVDLKNFDGFRVKPIFIHDDSFIITGIGKSLYISNVYEHLKSKLAGIIPSKFSIKTIVYNEKSDNEHAFVISEKGEIYRFNLRTFKAELLQDLSAGLGGDFYLVRATLNKKGTQLAVAFDNRKIYFMDVKTNKIIYTQNELTTFIWGIDFNEDDSRYALSMHGEVQVFDAATHKIIYKIIPLRNREPILFNAASYYVAPKKSLEAITYEFGNKYYPAEQFDLIYNRPDLVLQSIGKSDSSLLKAYKQAWKKRMKQFGSDTVSGDFHASEAPEISVINQQSIPVITNQQRIKIKVFTSDENYIVDKLFLWVNHVPEFGSAGILLPDPDKTGYYNIEFALSPGENMVQFSCINANGVESPREVFYIRYEPLYPVKPNLHIVVMSVSKYQDTRYNLKYAVKDGRDIAHMFGMPDSTERSKYNKIFIDTLFNENVQRYSLDSLLKKIGHMDVTDEVILYVSGHGLLDDKFNFYYATQNMDFDQPSKFGIPYEELEGFLDKIDARKKLLLIDACHSGELDKDEVERTQQIDSSKATDGLVVARSGSTIRSGYVKPKMGASSFELMQDLFENPDRGSGAAVITASAGTSFALESPLWNNGIFTWAVIYGLKDHAADEDKNGTITINELNKFVTEQVKSKTRGIQKPTARRLDPEFDWVVW